MLAEWWQEPSQNVGYLESVKIWSQIDSLSDFHNNRAGGKAANGQDVSYWFGPRQSSSKYKIDGLFEAAVIFNPLWAKNGIALCGSDSGATYSQILEKKCLTVDKKGNVFAMGAMSSGAGLIVKSGPTLLQSVFAQSYRQPLKTPYSSSAACDPGEFSDDINYHYVCVRKNKWKRVKLDDF